LIARNSTQAEPWALLSEEATLWESFSASGKETLVVRLSVYKVTHSSGVFHQ